MKILTTLALLLLSLNSYAEPTIEECNEKADFEKATMTAALSGKTIRDYLQGIDRSKWEHALEVYGYYISFSTARINGKFQTTTLEALATMRIEDNSISCYREAIGMKYAWEDEQDLI